MNKLDFDELPDTGLIRLKDMIRPRGPVPFSKSTLYALMAKGQFPANRKLSARVSAWSVAEVRTWLAGVR